jgi:hypothetical protein
VTLLASLRQRERQAALLALLRQTDPQGLIPKFTVTVDGTDGRHQAHAQYVAVYVQTHQLGEAA